MCRNKEFNLCHLQQTSLLALALLMQSHNLVEADQSTNTGNTNETSAFHDAATLFRRYDNNNDSMPCDGYDMFLEDLDLMLTAIDITLFLTDFMHTAVEFLIRVWDFFNFYILGFVINYNDFQYAVGLGPYFGTPISNVVTTLALTTIGVNALFFHPLARFLEFLDNALGNYSNVTLVMGITAQFEHEIFQMMGLREMLQDYFKNYNDCYIKRLQSQGAVVSNSTRVVPALEVIAPPTFG